MLQEVFSFAPRILLRKKLFMDYSTRIVPLFPHKHCKASFRYLFRKFLLYVIIQTLPSAPKLTWDEIMKKKKNKKKPTTHKQCHSIIMLKNTLVITDSIRVVFSKKIFKKSFTSYLLPNTDTNKIYRIQRKDKSAYS